MKLTSYSKKWYDWLEKTLAPTAQIANIVLVVLILVTFWVLFQKSATLKAGWIAYWVSP
ncbi:MAG: hypothetical protein ACRDFB_06445 [Rhabdochlamydiaceae bacterium]